MRAILDPNVLISALLSPSGSPARILTAWSQGSFELVVSPALIAELERALAYPKLRQRIPPPEAGKLIEWLLEAAEMADDAAGVEPPVRSPDPGDDYLICLAAEERALLVSGDRHLLELSNDLPIYSPAELLELLEREDG